MKKVLLLLFVAIWPCLAHAAEASETSWYGWQTVGSDAGALLVLIACAGLVVQAHLLIVDVALLAGFAVALLGFCMIRDRPIAGGILLGTGAGLGFLAKGLLAPGCLGLTATPSGHDVALSWSLKSHCISGRCGIFVILPWAS